MPLFQVHLVVDGDLRLSEEFTLDGYQFSPRPEGFGLTFQIEATSSEVAKKDAYAKVQLLMDSITLAKGPSLRHHFRQITKMPSKEGSQVLTTEVYASTDAYLVIKEGKEGIVPAIELAKRIPGHKKADVLARVLRWHARGTSDSDSVDKFVDYWIALETLADSYGDKVEPYVCQDCGYTVNQRPVNGVLRAYLRSLEMVEAAERISTLAEARAKLFHEASTRALEYLSEVQGILKTCIQKELA